MNTSTGVEFGTVGTIVSGRDSASALTVLVAWDGFDGGHGGNGLTQCPPDETEDNNRWWVDCDAIELLAGNGTIDCACDSQFDAGDIVVCVVDGFEGADYGLGRRGRVIAGVANRGAGDIVLVQWDGWFNGHDGIGFIYAENSCPTYGDEGSSRWWVPCDHIAKLVGCTADINGDGEVNGAGLTIVLGAWASCP